MSKIAARTGPRLTGAAPASLEPLERRRLLAAAAALDPGFGVGGAVVTDILPAEPGPDVAVAVLPMPDGRVITVGSTIAHEQSSFTDFRGVVTRYHSNGIADSTFGSGGTVIIDLGIAFLPVDAARLADGSVLVLGSRARVGHEQFEDNGHVFFEEVEIFEFVLVRISPAGEIDTSASNQDLGATLSFNSQMLRQADGRILITATDERDTEDTGDDRAAVIRLKADGTRDAGFGSNGVAAAPAALVSGFASLFAVRDNGKIILGLEEADETVQIAQLSANGTTDTSFGGGDGVIDVDSTARNIDQIAPAPDGGFYATKWDSRQSSLFQSLVKLTATGAIDPTFAAKSFPERFAAVELLVQDDGKLLVAANEANSPEPEGNDPVIGRYNPDGTLDTSFGSSGWFLLLTSQENDSTIRDVALSAQGIYAAGTADDRFLTFRLIEATTPPPAGGVVATLIGDTLNVIGTPGNDVIAIRSAAGNKIEVLSAGVVIGAFETAAVKRLAVAADAGDDVIDARDLVPLVTAGVDFPVTIDGAGGRDVLVGSQGRDRITGGDDNDRIAGWDGDDWISGNAQKDRLDGGAGNDSIFGNGGRDTLGGNVGNDTLFGGDQPDFLTGWTGDDSLEGGGGHDRIDGGAGHDTLAGGGGDDRLFARDNEIDHVIGGWLRFDRAEVDEDDILVNIEQLL